MERFTTKFILMLSCFLLFCLHSHVKGQGLSFTFKVTVSDTTCYTKGKLNVKLTNLSSLVKKIRYELTSTTIAGFGTLVYEIPNHSGVESEHTFESLRGGMYNVNMIVFDQGGGFFKQSQNNIRLESSYSEPSIIIGDRSPSIKCMSTGSASFYFLGGLGGGSDTNFKYNLLYKAPDEESFVIYKQMEGVTAGSHTHNPNNRYTINGLPSGDYRIELIDECNYVILNTAFTIGVSTDILPENAVSSAFHRPDGTPSTNCKKLAVNLEDVPFTNEFFSYWNGMAKIEYYEYGWGEDGNDPVQWMSFTDATITEVPIILSSNYKDIIKNPDRLPKLFVRLKNSDCSSETKDFSIDLKAFELDYYVEAYKCEDQTFDIVLSIGGSQIGCGDVTLEIAGPTKPIVDGQLTFRRPDNRISIAGLHIGQSYELRATDGNGLQAMRTIFLSPLDMKQDIHMESFFGNPCVSGSSGTIEVISSYKGFLWGGYSVELVLSPNSVIPPMFEAGRIYTFPDDYDNQSFYLFSEDISLPQFYPIPTGWYELGISNATCASIGRDTIRYYYAGGTHYTIEDFSINTLKSCEKVQALINADSHPVRQGDTKRPVYIRVYNELGEREESVTYHRSNGDEYMEKGSTSAAGYLKIDPDDPSNNWENRGYMLFQKAGNYNVRVSADTDFSLTKRYTCMIDSRDVVIQIKQFSLDSLKSGSYACDEELFLSVSAKDGGYQSIIGGEKVYTQFYSYELYKTEEDATAASTIESAEGREPVVSQRNIPGGVVALLGGTSNDIVEIIKNRHAYILIIDASCEERRRFVVSVPIANLTDGSGFSLTGGGKFCIGDTVTLNATHLGDVTYEWSEWNGTQYEKIATNKTPQLILNGVQSTGIYRVSVSLCDAIYEAYDTVYVAPEVLIWRGDAGDNNWNNPNNWGIAYDKVTGLGEGPLEVGTAIYTVPGECTTVHIPGNARRYPDFAKTYGEPVCDAIVYHFGGETGSPHLLKYNRAYIEFNWGYDEDPTNEGVFKNWEDNFPAYKNNVNEARPPRIKSRDRWYMISAPLMKVASGDFSVAGYPKTFQRLFNAVNPQTDRMTPGDFCNPFNTNGIDLKVYSNSALAVWVPSHNGSIVGLANHKNLDDLHGKIRLPYIEYDEKYAGGAYQMYHGKGHAMHRYNHNVEKDGENISIFPYYYEGDLSPYPEDKDPTPGKMPRKIGSKGAFEDPSRFVFEEDATRAIKKNNGIAVYNMTVSGSSHTDPEPGGTGGIGVYVMIGNPFMSHLDFTAFYNANSGVVEPFYKVFLANSWETRRINEDYKPLIAPLQSFVVKLLGVNLPPVLAFPVSGENNVSTTGRGDMLKAATLGIRDNEIQIELSNSVGKTEAIVAWGVQDLRNIDILYNTSYPKVPQVFVVGEDFMYNSVQYEKNNRTEIPLGVYSALKGEMTLSFNGVADNTMLNRLSLWDKKLNKEQDIYINPVYTFDHQDDMEADRFVLRVENSQTNTETTSSYFNVYVDKGSLYVQSSVEIQRIRMCAANGVVAMEDNPVGKFYYSKSTGLVAGVYILSVDLVNGNREVRKIVIE